MADRLHGDARRPLRKRRHRPAARIGFGGIDDGFAVLLKRQDAERCDQRAAVEIKIEAGDERDDVIEVDECRHSRQRVVVAGIDQNAFAVDPLGLQQRRQKRDVVLAIAIAVREHGLRRVGHHRPAAKLYRDIANMLDEPEVKRAHLLAAVRHAFGDVVGQRLDFRRHGRHGRSCRRVSPPQRGVVGKCGDREMRQTLKRRNGDGLGRGRMWRAEMPAIDRLLALLRLREVDVVIFDEKVERLRRRQRFANLVEGHLARISFVVPELTRENRVLRRYARRVDRDVLSGKLRKNDRLEVNIGEHRHLRRAGRELIVDRADIHRNLLPVRLLRVGLEYLEILGREVVRHRRLSKRHRRGGVVRPDLRVHRLDAATVGRQTDIDCQKPARPGRGLLPGRCGAVNGPKDVCQTNKNARKLAQTRPHKNARPQRR